MNSNEAKSKDVFFKGLKRNNTDEYSIHPYLKAKFSIFCDELIMKNPTASLELLYDAAAMTFRFLRDHPQSEIPTVTIE